jgi:hypothetical protein
MKPILLPIFAYTVVLRLPQTYTIFYQYRFEQQNVAKNDEELDFNFLFSPVGKI